MSTTAFNTPSLLFFVVGMDVNAEEVELRTELEVELGLV
jgi:hypothetical protein